MSTNEELIAAAKEAVEGHAPTEAEAFAYRLADALEKVTAERDELSRALDNAAQRVLDLRVKQARAADRDQLAAVVYHLRLLTDGSEWNGGQVDDILNSAPSVALDRVKAEARESVVTPEAREHWEWTQKSRRAHGYEGCVCALCGVMERVYEKGESND